MLITYSYIKHETNSFSLHRVANEKSTIFSFHRGNIRKTVSVTMGYNKEEGNEVSVRSADIKVAG